MSGVNVVVGHICISTKCFNWIVTTNMICEAMKYLYTKYMMEKIHSRGEFYSLFLSKKKLLLRSIHHSFPDERRVLSFQLHKLRSFSKILHRPPIPLDSITDINSEWGAVNAFSCKQTSFSIFRAIHNNFSTVSISASLPIGTFFLWHCLCSL